ncbi:MAG: preprotein translocase subunit SecG [Bacteroidales bacterium]|nr:preprotein translocase subunit SecG [Bacteroidales bacterium]
MHAAYIVISIIIVLASVLLTLVVIVQNSKGGGLAANFASGNQTFGVRQTADFLEKLTWGLAATIIALCIIANFVLPSKKQQSTSTLKQQLEQTEQPATEFPAGTLPIEGAASESETK